MKLIPKQFLEKIEKSATVFFLSASVFVSFFMAEAIILTLAHQFKLFFLYLSLAPAFVIAMFFSNHIKKDIKFLPKISVSALLLILLISLLLIFYPHDTFGGRDEAGYANLAVHLAKTSSLKIPSYLDNLPGNPAEGYRITPSGYTIWLGVMRSFFGDQGLLRGNLIIIILGLSAFILVSSYLGGSKIGLIAATLFASSMPFLWFSRETLSENLSFFLLWSLILFLFIFLKTRRHIYLFITILAAWIFALTRLEGFLIQFVLLLVIPLILFILKFTSKKNILFITFLFLIVVVSNLIISRTTIVAFLIQVVPSVNYSLKRDVSAMLPKIIIPNITQSTLPIKPVRVTNLYDKMTIFYAQMLAKYNMFLVIISIFLVTCQLFVQIKKPSQNKHYYLLILIILLPEFYKFISPGVTPDEPWLYRRYMYALLPFGYLSLSLFLSQFKHQKRYMIVLIVFFIINFYLSRDILFLKNNWHLINKIEKITENITTGDLFIIRATDQRPLDYYYLNSYLLFRKGIRMIDSYNLEKYNFDPKNKIFNNIPYEKIYLLSTDNLVRFPPFTAINKKTIETDYLQLIPSCRLYLLGEEKGLADAYNIGVLPFSDVAKYCSKPGNEIAHRKETLYLYELVYD